MVRNYEDGVSTCKVGQMCLQVVFLLRNTLRNFHKWISFCSSFRSREMGFVLRNFMQQKVDFAADFVADFAVAKFSHNLMQLSSNGHNFFVSTPIRTLFEALDS